MLKSPLGFLYPLNPDLTLDASKPNIPVLEGDNLVGRCDLAVPDNRVSRKQISLRAGAGGVELAVEGQNPIILTSGVQRKKLNLGDKIPINYGDIIELIPGSYFFKYVKVDSEKHVSSHKMEPGSLPRGKRTLEDDFSNAKRHRQIAADEALARSLQDEERHNNSSVQESAQHHYSSRDDSEPICDFKVSKAELSLAFRLLRVRGLPSWANTSSVSIADVIEGNVQIAILSNYMMDIDWLLSACPHLRTIPHVLLIHGESGARVEYLKENKPTNWVLHKPPLPISYGTHHSKAIFLVYPKGVRVIVHTANLINVDWNNKSQGLWMQDFPWKDNTSPTTSPFESDLVDYLSVLKWPKFSVNIPTIGNAVVNASFFKKFDYSKAAVRLISSVPGYHTGPNLRRWGHMKLRTVLEEYSFDKEFCKSPLVYQFSSLGSLDEKWLSELASSMSAGFTEDKMPLGLGKPLIIWPTVEDVRCSLEGYSAGSAIPSPQKNVEKDFLKKYWARWMASHTGRCRAMPHIKTYTRYCGQNLAWFLLTSSNLSKAAWGSLQKNSSQLMIRSYELGVLFLPSRLNESGLDFCCTDTGDKQGGNNLSIKGQERKIKLRTLFSPGSKPSDDSDSSSRVISLPVPYELPPKPYTAEDVPWSWDRRYTKKDVYGHVWPH